MLPITITTTINAPVEKVWDMWTLPIHITKWAFASDTWEAPYAENDVKYAEQMIEKDIRVNGEFYVCPVFNEAILDGKKVKTFHIEKMWGLGTPEDLRYFLENHRG
jgi:hypothetical protein